MDLTLHTTFLPHTDPEASLRFYRDLLGFELTQDVGQGDMRWLTFVAPTQPGVRLVLTPPVADPGVSDDERRTVVELMAKGVYQSIILATKDLDGTFARLQGSDVEVVSEPTDQPWGVRDCAFRDPAGNMVRIDQVA
ncbi:putative glyoxalase superfamily protein PhnB [Isoptericola jiangsuensis]|uniref:Putative glyoxalase superfamily protein PhnB n=1 Tax=Isoptericola jiangsuensis TaxID=548579 RepID=A0A2A9EYI5_9MICO|nr:VOC family protein [Isoptericola jiangsuensis]PFG43219.1 putative glyoxalase superfamily protein PhnB [Isoptericola jiangsuensis]